MKVSEALISLLEKYGPHGALDCIYVPTGIRATARAVLGDELSINRSQCDVFILFISGI